MAERIFDMCSKAVAAAKSFNPAQVFFAVFPDRCKRSAVRSLHVGKSEASMEARKAGGCVRAGIVDGGRFVVGRVPAEPGAECIAALAKDPRALVIKDSLMASGGKNIEGPGISEFLRACIDHGTGKCSGSAVFKALHDYWIKGNG
jgi:hypothetical protein